MCRSILCLRGENTRLEFESLIFFPNIVSRLLRGSPRIRLRVYTLRVNENVDLRRFSFWRDFRRSLTRLK